ncbi:MAG TPA: very short patch repair endonuclease [Phycisphaerae bacterium]|nr:very short patch repair endonuclease [Phycisphaerae bacterium]HRW54510.1 very short patch repair endonuclease [Phycisphaerae bacterium]
MRTDPHTPAQRSFNMSRIRGRDTKPEMAVRRFLHRRGYRYRLHVSGLKGKPDLVFTRRRKAIFVHGCFWHRHSCDNGRAMPKSRAEFWNRKFRDTRKRDEFSLKSLETEGWKTFVIWECEIRRNCASTWRQLIRFLGPPQS